MAKRCFWITWLAQFRLFCTPGTPRDTLDVWPAFPLIISTYCYITEDLNNLIALLEPRDRVCQKDLMGVPRPHHVLAAMQTLKPFPQLTDLKLRSNYMAPVIPDSFLGGSAPSLRELWLDYTPFPGLPKLLLSATNLVGPGSYSRFRVLFTRGNGHCPLHCPLLVDQPPIAST